MDILLCLCGSSGFCLSMMLVTHVNDWLSVQELEAMTRYTSPVNPAVFPHLTVVLMAIGMFFTAWFFVYPSLFTHEHLVIRKLLVKMFKYLHP